MTDILVWTCKACGARHPPTQCRCKATDRCPQCKELTPHEWVMLEPKPNPVFAVIVIEPGTGDRWVLSKHSDLEVAREVQRTAEAEMPGAKIKISDWTGFSETSKIDVLTEQ